MLRFCSLSSGSAGNATLVEASDGHHTTRLLIDCGLPLRELDMRLAKIGLSASDLDAVFVTHEHSDHIGNARALVLRERLPCWMSSGTWHAVNDPDFEGLLQIARDEQPIELQTLCVQPFTVPHDAREPLQLSCTDGQVKLGILTDLGQGTNHVHQALAQCHALLLECNHDTELLKLSKYPPFLRQRIAGPQGHLSNGAAAEILSFVKHPGLKHVVAAHLSAQNNRPDLAQAALAEVLGCQPKDICVADQALGSPWMRV
jgi:phosphoribosyl 1,2-cyclic phosphodiesterase